MSDRLGTYKRAFDLDALLAPVRNAWERFQPLSATLGSASDPYQQRLGARTRNPRAECKKKNNIPWTTRPTVQSSSE